MLLNTGNRNSSLQFLLPEIYKFYQPKNIAVKFDDQLAAFLYENKTLKLEGIGTFTLDNKVSVPGPQDKEVYFPIEGLSFVYNPKSATDESVIIFLVKSLRKIEPLIRSDLESYLSDIKQFLNLGKPYTIAGVGTLNKNNQGTYEFTPGNFLPAKEELNPKRENAEHNYPVRSQSNAGRVFIIILIIVAALAALGGIGWGISSLISGRQAQAGEQQYSPAAVSDTLPAQDTTSVIKSPAISAAAPPAAEPVLETGDSVRYKMVFEITRSKERAIARTSQLNTYGHHSRYDSIRINDSVRYRLFLPVKTRPADTLRIKDSLSTFLGKKVRVLKQ